MDTTTSRSRGWLRGLGPALTAGGVAGVLEVVLATSLAALVFSGGLAENRGAGIGLAIFGGAVVMLVIAVFSSVPFSVGSIQDTTATIIALLGARTAADVRAEMPSSRSCWRWRRPRWLPDSSSSSWAHSG